MSFVPHLFFDGNTLMGSDDPTGGFEPPRGFSVNVTTSSIDKARRVFDALADDGTVNMPLGETSWSPAFAMLQDRFGINWMINTEPAG